jgi:hypothetical protein
MQSRSNPFLPVLQINSSFHCCAHVRNPGVQLANKSGF